MSKMETLKNSLLDEEGRILKTQYVIVDKLRKTIGAAGYLTQDFINTSNKNRQWVWEMQDYKVKVTFSNPKYKKMTSSRGTPIVISRTPENALLLTTENPSDVAVTRKIEKSVEIATNATVSKTDTFNFNVSAGIKGGQSGTEGNGGLTVIAHLEASFGGEFVRQWIGEKGHKSVVTISDELTMQPKSSYQVTATVDKLEIEQSLTIEGIIDFDVKLELPHYKGKHKEHTHNDQIQAFNGGADIEADSLRDLARYLTGLKGGLVRGGQFWKPERTELMADYISQLIDEEYRKIKVTSVLKYGSAGESYLKVNKMVVPKTD